MIFFYLGLIVGWKMDRECECTNSNSMNLRAGGDDTATKDSPSAMADALKAMGKLVDEQKANEESWAIALANMKVELDEHQDIADRVKKDAEKKLANMKVELDKHKGILDKMKKEAEKKQTEKTATKEGSGINEPYYKDLFHFRFTGNFAQGFGFVDRNEFASHIDAGMPMDQSGHGNDHVFMLYSDGSAMPDSNATKVMHPNGWEGVSAEDATKNCRNLHVVYSDEGRRQQCIAIVGQYESFHVQKFMRMADSEKQSERVVDMNLPLRFVNRNMQLNGEKGIQPPRDEATKAYWKVLVPYINSLDEVLKDLKPIAKSVASNNKYNTIVIMVCNFGHSEMLVNFVCNAHAKGEETTAGLKNILVFSTDVQTHNLVQSLGLTSFYSPAVFGETPKEAATEYGDAVYSKIMVSKVYCVQLISQLGYDLLFQDVDMVWYKDPVPWFHRETPDEANNNFVAKEWDMVFQDDGARTLFFSPYSANTGFYFVRNNRTTKYFFNQLLLSGDLVASLGSHQSALITQLAEFASLYGLKIKSWQRFSTEFPGGHNFHQQRDFMKKLILSKNSTDARGLINNDKNNEIDPYIFHMSWTRNKEMKLKFFEQLGEWYLMDKCNVNHPNFNESALNTATINSCCAAKPLFKCHYQDKPSMIPCPESPFIDQEKKSFW